ncbi:zf-HC2 domain-containing protein [Streptomyces sp. NPDC001980]|uniref:zf-HC2 domain-containing protein n=1 Tax=Streptomyces sp. NPDC001980 TaxID=3157126 RepID=UPI003318C2C1
MSGDAHCEKLREVGAELALGVLPGRERAEAVAHLDGCAACREYVRQLTGIGDRLIGLLPESDPPPGFETRVARSLAEQAAGAEGARAVRRGHVRVRRLRLRLAAVAATAAVAVGFAGWAVGSAVEGAVTASAPAVESEPVLVGDMIPAGGGQPVGEVYAHPGSPAWMFVSVALPGTPYNGRVTCLLARADGTSTRVGDFPLRDGRGNWGVAVPVDLTRYSAARLTSADGSVLATAQLQKGKVVTPEVS